jgi:elongation factor P--(R)-beta-lysine ligase
MNDWQPVAEVSALQRRARVLADIRAFFAARGVLEVTTPLITPAGITDVHIESLPLADGQFLRTSPEYAHKRLLAAGYPDLYELGPVFRAEEHGRFHRSEFWLLEWYRRDFTWRQLAEEVIELIEACLGHDRLQPRFLGWADSYYHALGFDPLSDDEQTLIKLTSTLPADCDRDMRLDYLFATEIQPRFPADSLTVIHDYPASQAALARLKPGDPRLAERFEVFIGPVELANGYRELTSADEQRQRFERDNQRRLELGRRAMPLDERFLAALEHGLPECSGVALGVDRLLMAALDCSDIGQTLAQG